MQRLPYNETVILPLFEERCAQYDEAVARVMSAAAALAPVVPLRLFREASSKKVLGGKPLTPSAPSLLELAAAVEGPAVTVFGTDTAALKATAQDLRAQIDSEYKTSDPIETRGIPEAHFNTFVERIRGVLAADGSAEVAVAVPLKSLTIRALGEVALLRAVLAARDAIMQEALAGFEIKPPEWWDPDVPSEKVRLGTVGCIVGFIFWCVS